MRCVRASRGHDLALGGALRVVSLSKSVSVASSGSLRQSRCPARLIRREAAEAIGRRGGGRTPEGQGFQESTRQRT